MNEPLASAAGNAVEVRNAVDFLAGRRRDARLARVTLALGAELLHLAGLAPTIAEGGRLLQRDARMRRGGRTVRAHGRGARRPADLLARAARFCRAPASSSRRGRSARGIVAGVDVRAVGLAVVELGGGRARAADAIDPSVGLTELAPRSATRSAPQPAARDRARARRRSRRRRPSSACAQPIGSATRRLRAVDPVVERMAPRR